jgi:hypothetical protein
MKLLIAFLAIGVSATVLHAQTDADREAVRAAALDYIEGFYEGDSTKHVRSVAPSVYKYGYSRRQDGSYGGSQMPFEIFMAFDRGVKAGRNLPPANAPKEVLVFEVLDQIASAKVTAYWGVDYLLLAKVDGRWLIKQVIWQTPPPK